MAYIIFLLDSTALSPKKKKKRYPYTHTFINKNSKETELDRLRIKTNFFT